MTYYSKSPNESCNRRSRKVWDEAKLQHLVAAQHALCCGPRCRRSRWSAHYVLSGVTGDMASSSESKSATSSPSSSSSSSAAAPSLPLAQCAAIPVAMQLIEGPCDNGFLSLHSFFDALLRLSRARAVSAAALAQQSSTSLSGRPRPSASRVSRRQQILAAGCA
jgi:hypothetical protein